MDIIYADATTEISYVPGDAHSAIVSFAGIGMGMGGIQIAEFHKSLTGTAHHIYFVKDLSKHWYNTSFEVIKNALNDDMAARGITQVSTIGNSMGGFGAITFAAVLAGCRTALAFGPQSAVDPNIVPWEDRFPACLTDVTHWNGLDAKNMLSNNISYTLIFGDDDPVDAKHAERFVAAGCDTMDICMVAGTGHFVVVYLKHLRAHQAIIDTVVREGVRCTDFDAAFRGLPVRMLVTASKCPSGDSASHLSRLPPVEKSG